MAVKYVSESNLGEFARKLNEKQKTIFAPIGAVGSPLVAATVAAMTDHAKVYVYTGDETGYVYGNWYYWDGSAWTSGGVYNAVIYDTDTTLTESGKPADAKVVGDKIAEADADIKISESEIFGNVDSTFPIRFEAGTYRSVTAGNELEKYHGGGYDNTRKVLEETVFNAPCEVKLTAKEGFAFDIYNLTDGVITSERNNLTVFILYKGYQYGIKLKAANGTDDISSLSAADIIEIDYDSRVDVLEDMNAAGLSELPEDIGLSTYSIWINSSLRWSATNSGKSSILKTPTAAKFIEITANQDKQSRVAFLLSNAHDPNTDVEFCEGTTLFLIPAGETRRFSVPNDARYLCMTKKLSGESFLPSSVTYFCENGEVKPIGLHEWPAYDSTLNIVKRCRQLTDIKWIPAVDKSRYMRVQRGGGVDIPDTAEPERYLGTFKAGVEYTGIPYGRVSTTMSGYGYSYGTIGNYISLDTFISSISNPKSRLSKTASGSLANHQSTIYATVCSGFTCYALNVPEVATSMIPSISSLRPVGKLNNDGEYLSDWRIRVGDVLNSPPAEHGHTAIITDIIRGQDGMIKSVEISEATSVGLADRTYSDGPIGGLCRRKGHTRDSLFAAGGWGDYTVYRYFGNVPYTPSAYVNVGDEFDDHRVVHFPIMPYEGEGFAFKTGYIPDNAVKLVITLGGYDYVKVFKDGVEVTGSPFDVTTDVQTGEINDVSVSEIGEGSYTAYLCNIADGNVTNLTYACHWTIGS